MFTIYGDESTSGATTIYGAYFVPASQITQAEVILRDSKVEAGVPESAELHSCVLFHGDHRKDSPWAHLTEEQAYDYAQRLLDRLRSLPCIYSVGAVQSSEYPQELPAGSGFPAGQFDTKQLIALAFQAATVPLIQGIDRARVTLHADPDSTRIRWFGKKVRADSNYVIAGGEGIGDLPIAPQPPGSPLPPLLEVADLFAYAAGRALSPDPVRGKERYEAMYRACRPHLSVMTYDPVLRMQGKLPPSLLDARHAAVCFPDGPLPTFSQLPPGACTWMNGVNGLGDSYPVLMMRVPTGTASPLLASQFNLDIRWGVIPSGGYPLVVFLVRLPGVPTLFAMFLNPFAREPISPIRSLAGGTPLRLALVEDGPRPVGEVPFPNVSPAFWINLDVALSQLPPFDERAHDAAVAALNLGPEQMWDLF